MTSLQEWESFYVIVGSSAGALTGLQFVVMTLISEIDGPAGGETVAAFGTPNVVHFCAALLVSCVMSAPWDRMSQAGIVVAACGAAGLVYSGVVLKRALRQRDYRPVLEDWIWHTILPILAYASLLIWGVVCPHSPGALFVIAGAALLLVFVGIHNAWDTVTYVMLTERARKAATRARQNESNQDRERRTP